MIQLLLTSLVTWSDSDNQGEAVPNGLSSIDPCAVAPVVGPCKGTFPRWYYDQNAGECKHFLYGGCQGNHNNFLQESDCVSECIQKGKGFIVFNPFVDRILKVLISDFFWNCLRSGFQTGNRGSSNHQAD